MHVSSCTHTLEMAFSIFQLVLCSKMVIKIITWQQLLAHVDVISMLCYFTTKGSVATAGPWSQHG